MLFKKLVKSWFFLGFIAGFTYGLQKSNGFVESLLWGVIAGASAGLSDLITRRIKSDLLSWILFGSLTGALLTVFQLMLIWKMVPNTSLFLLVIGVSRVFGFGVGGLMIYFFHRKRTE